MNALTRAAVSVPRTMVMGRYAAPRRNMATFPPKQESFRKLWLSDPSTYPIIVILTGAITAAFGFISYKVMYCPNVRITSKCKGKVIRTWT